MKPQTKKVKFTMDITGHDVHLEEIVDVPVNITESDLNDEYLAWVYDQFTGGFEDVTPEPKAEKSKKIQKKIYLTPLASAYLSRIQSDTGKSQGDIIEDLITRRYKLSELENKKLTEEIQKCRIENADGRTL